MSGTKVFTVVLCGINFLFQGSFCSYVPLVEKVVVLSRLFLRLRSSFMFYCGFSHGVADCSSRMSA
jgi:hypothetical protein